MAKLTLDEHLEKVLASCGAALDACSDKEAYAAIHSWQDPTDGSAMTVLVFSGDRFDLADEFLVERLPGVTRVVPS